jgi:uncharacterized protein
VAFAAAACLVLAGYNNLAGVQPWHRRWYPAVNALAATATLAAAAASGLTADDLGLRRDRLRSGLRLGSMAAAPVAAACGLAALTPATRPLLNDQRVAGLDRRQLTYHVLLRIPLGTVAWEEAAFRGVLQATLRRVLAEPAATAVASAVFGIWHIRPAAEALAANRLATTRGRCCCTWPQIARPRWPAPWPGHSSDNCRRRRRPPHGARRYAPPPASLLPCYYVTYHISLFPIT